MKETMKKFKTRLFETEVIAVTTLLMLMPEIACAEDLSSTKLVTGLNKLINDATSALMVIAIPVAGLAAAFFLIRRAMADQQDQKQWTDRAKAAVVCGIGAVVVGGIIKVLASYFQ